MAEAYVLAGELTAAGGNHEAAFARYEKRMMPFIRSKQETAKNLASSFALKTEFRIVPRDLATRLMDIPFLADTFIGRDLRDDIEWPEYESTVTSSRKC